MPLEGRVFPRLASLLRRRSVALYHVFLLSPHARSAICAEPRPPPLRLRTSAQALSIRSGGIYAERIHLLLSEPEVGTSSTVMRVFKQADSSGFVADFDLRTEKKRWRN